MGWENRIVGHGEESPEQQDAGRADDPGVRGEAGVAYEPLTQDELEFYVATVRWQFAKTMPENPHEYTVKKWADPRMFERVVTHIRASGYVGRFGGRKYTYFRLGDHVYWTMGAPLEATIIINRKHHTQVD